VRDERKNSNESKSIASKPGHLILVCRGKVVYETMVKNIGKELISKVVTPETGVHMSIYEKKGTLAKHVTHEKYPKGHGRRHTQRNSADLNRLVYAQLLIIAPNDDPPPADVTGPTDERLIRWFERSKSRLSRNATNRQVWIFKGAVGNLLDALWTLSEDEGVKIDLTDIVEHGDEIPEEDLISKIREDELREQDRPWGFSEDFSKIVVVLNDRQVFEVSLSRLAEAQRIIAEELGVNGFARTIRRTSSARLQGQRENRSI